LNTRYTSWIHRGFGGFSLAKRKTGFNGAKFIFLSYLRALERWNCRDSWQTAGAKFEYFCATSTRLVRTTPGGQKLLLSRDMIGDYDSAGASPSHNDSPADCGFSREFAKVRKTLPPGFAHLERFGYTLQM
jgi:hypothetical protein